MNRKLKTLEHQVNKLKKSINNEQLPKKYRGEITDSYKEMDQSEVAITNFDNREQQYVQEQNQKIIKIETRTKELSTIIENNKKVLKKLKKNLKELIKENSNHIELLEQQTIEYSKQLSDLEEKVDDSIELYKSEINSVKSKLHNQLSKMNKELDLQLLEVEKREQNYLLEQNQKFFNVETKIEKLSIFIEENREKIQNIKKTLNDVKEKITNDLELLRKENIERNQQIIDLDKKMNKTIKTYREEINNVKLELQNQFTEMNKELESRVLQMQKKQKISFLSVGIVFVILIIWNFYLMIY